MVTSQPSRASTFTFYVTLLLVTGSSVVLGLDWMSAPLPPMHETEASVQAAKAAAKFPPPVQRVAVVKPPPRQVLPPAASAQPAQRPAVATAVPGATAPTGNGTPAIMAPEQTAQPEPASTQPKCDVVACSAAYRSFRESDCTWQPFNGPRRFCDKGTPPQDVATNDPNATVDAAPLSNKCDQEACKRAYFTFDPSDCTYQPTNGPRRLCERGSPPKPDAAAATAPDAPSDAKPKADGEPAAPAAGATTSANAPKCNVDACKAAYISFDAADCTYQPTNGPRRLCTK